MTITRDSILEWINAFATVIHTQKDYLTELDSAIGDADHGENMDRGMQAVLLKLPGVVDKDIGAILKTVAMTLISTVGGASGPLYGTLFLEMAKSTTGKTELTLDEWVVAMEGGINGVIMRGKAQVGDKTMVDALNPALTALKAAAANNIPLKTALQNAAEAARVGRDSITPLVARKGRASYLGERSVNHQDPGATSTHFLLKSAADTLAAP